MADKGNKKVIEASTAVAIGVKLAEPTVIGMYPITPQTHVVERLAEFINDGDMDCEMIHVESEHAAISSCLGACAAGSRVFTATSSQGLALMFEVLPIVSGMRLPIVMAVANRALSAPINIWNDHSDTIACRDSGWIQLYVESAQEALDTVLMAYKIAEDKKVLLPVMVGLDGFTLTHVFEPVDIPTRQQAKRFLPVFKPNYPVLDPKKTVTLGPVAFPDTYMEFRKELQAAMMGSSEVIKKVSKEFKSKFKREYGNGLVEGYRMNGAKYAVVAMGTACGTARVVVDELRKSGKKVGLIKIKCFRPFPEEDIISMTKSLKGIAVIDRAISYGHTGSLYCEIKAAVNNPKIKMTGFIAGLGGRDITVAHIRQAFDQIGSKETVWLL
jgi:pyruvate ferredoxin oxidoreductase alpha subunit